ncbi:MAG: hypothetical protein AAF667_12300 [Pseudomonadota bacterium]
MRINTLVLTLAFAGPVAADIVRVPYDPLLSELDTQIDFETYPKKMSPGTKLDNVQSFDGASFGERFRGQSVVQEDGFDALAGIPSGPLEVYAGAPSENLSVTFYFLISNHLVGNAAPGFPESYAGGEGAIAVLFDRDQRAIGFRVAAEPEPDTQAEKGVMTVSFFRRDGSIITQKTLPLDWGRGSYGFARTEDQRDIAGVTITNRDPAGIAIDDVIFDSQTVTGLAPTPDPVSDDTI